MSNLEDRFLLGAFTRPFGELTAFSEPGYEVKRMPEMSHAKVE